MQRSRIQLLIRVSLGLLTWLLISLPHIAKAGYLLITTLPALASGSAGRIYSTQLQAIGGTTPYTWSVAPGSQLPPGLGVRPGGMLSGTPTTTGSFSFTVYVIGSYPPGVSRIFSMTVKPLTIGPPPTLPPKPGRLQP